MKEKRMDTLTGNVHPQSTHLQFVEGFAMILNNL